MAEFTVSLYISDKGNSFKIVSKRKIAALQMTISSGSDFATESTDKRSQILQGAICVFLQHGYAGTSMDRVAAIAGVSKQTIYSYFQDKEGLFTALIEEVTIKRTKVELGLESFTGAPQIMLRHLAKAYLKKMGDPEYISLLRVVFGESTRFPELTQLFTRTVIQRGIQELAVYLREHPELHLADPEAIARIFMGSLVAFLVTQEILYGKLIIPMEQERLIENLVDLVITHAGQSARY